MELKIEKLVYGGDGLAYTEGAAAFVPYVLPGETVVAAPVEKKKKFVRARLEQIITSSAERIAALCPYFGVCGGCNYQHIPYEAQLAYKSEILRETLRRIGRIEWKDEIATHASAPWGYRNRAQWKVRPLEKSPGGPQKLDIGYFRSGSVTLCSVEQCPIVSPLLARTLSALRGALLAGELPRELREIEVFTNSDDTKLLFTASLAGFPSRADEHAARFRSLVPEIESLLFHDTSRDRMELDGPGFLECEAAGEKFRVGHFSFFQVNRFLNDPLVQAVTNSESGGLACDLYAGVGLFSLPLAKQFQRVISVESNPAAARDLEFNAATRAIEIRGVAVERALERLRERPDLVVLDPPRTGLEPGAAARLARLQPARITYVSCEPPTLARDLSVLIQNGYEIGSIDLFDLFPQTFHMETVVKLKRRT